MLRNWYTCVAIGIAILLIVGAYIKSDRISTTLMPRVESDYAYVTASLPSGSPEERVAAVFKRISDASRTVIAENGGQTLSRGFFSHVDDNVITSRIMLTPGDVRPIHTSEVTVKVRLPKQERTFEHNIETLMVRNPEG